LQKIHPLKVVHIFCMFHILLKWPL
jgi:hypothetical protein